MCRSSWMDGRLAEKLLYLYFPLQIFNWLHLFGEVAKKKIKLLLLMLMMNICVKKINLF